MLRKHSSKILLVIFFYFISIFQISAQIKEYRDTQVDSATFTTNRKLLNDLATDRFEKRTYETAKHQIPYRLLQPKNNLTGVKFPLVITFHNSTRIGNDNEKQLEPLARIWLRDSISANYPCYVIAPQFNKRSSNYENNADGMQIAKPSDEVFALLDLIENIQKEHPDIDKDRIYLVGYSMGASTAQNLMSIKPNKFAAMVAMAAVPDFSNLNKLAKKNIWLIHGEKDDENPYIGSVNLYNKLNLNKNLTFTTFKNLDHNNIAIPFLLTDEITKWLFDQHK
ncbi:MAG: alpha/beta fold hydrolase [Pedobacter sp.]|nr:MAG: alpha/beta fold hydrolase [Pedobacter sp.]